MTVIIDLTVIIVHSPPLLASYRRDCSVVATLRWDCNRAGDPETLKTRRNSSLSISFRHGKGLLMKAFAPAFTNSSSMSLALSPQMILPTPFARIAWTVSVPNSCFSTDAMYYARKNQPRLNTFEMSNTGSESPLHATYLINKDYIELFTVHNFQSSFSIRCFFDAPRGNGHLKHSSEHFA